MATQQTKRSGRPVGLGLAILAAAGLPLAVGSVDNRADGALNGEGDVRSLEAGSALADRVNQVFALRASTIVLLDFDGEPGQPLWVTVPIEGALYTLDLHPWPVRAPSYRLIVQGEDGSYEEVEPGPARTLGGCVVGAQESVVVGSLGEDGLSAKIIFSDDEQYWIEPISSRVVGAAPNQHVVYRKDDIIPCQGEFGVDDMLNPWGDDGPPQGDGPLRDGCGGLACGAELAIDADWHYYLDYGSSVSAVEDRVNLVIGTMNAQYESDVDILHMITTIIVRTSEASNPYTTSVCDELIYQFRNHWEEHHGAIPRDAAQLFTGRELDGCLGIAFMSAICTDYGYSVVQSDGWGGLECSTDVSAHELGHNWGADHCPVSGWTMYASITCSNQFHPSYTIPEIETFRDSLDCLDGLDPLSPDPAEFSFGPNGLSTVLVGMGAVEGDGGLPPPVSYYFDFVSGGSGGDDSGWDDSRFYYDFDLEPNTLYSYRVKARDSALVPNETAYSDTATTATNIETPTGVAFGTVTSDSVVLNATGTLTKLTVGDSGVYFDSATAGGNGGINQWIQTTTDTATGLSSDTLYDFQVKARNQLSVETGYAGPSGKATLAEVPAAPLLSNETCQSMDVAISPDGNPAITTYAIRCSDAPPPDVTWDGQYVDATGNPSVTPVYQTKADWGTTTVVNLAAVTTYTFEVNAQNQEGVETAAGPGAWLTTSYGDGDFEPDGDVDLADFVAFQRCLGQEGAGECSPGNMTGDELIDLEDFAEFYASLTGEAGGPT